MIRNKCVIFFVLALATRTTTSSSVYSLPPTIKTVQLRYPEDNYVDLMTVPLQMQAETNGGMTVLGKFFFEPNKKEETSSEKVRRYTGRIQNIKNHVWRGHCSPTHNAGLCSGRANQSDGNCCCRGASVLSSRQENRPRNANQPRTQRKPDPRCCTRRVCLDP